MHRRPGGVLTCRRGRRPGTDVARLSAMSVTSVEPEMAVYDGLALRTRSMLAVLLRSSTALLRSSDLNVHRLAMRWRCLERLQGAQRLALAVTHQQRPPTARRGARPHTDWL